MDIKSFASLTALFFLILAIISAFILSRLGKVFEERMPNNDNWATATIAIPLALFSILAPIYSYYCKRNSEIFVGEYDIKKIRKNSLAISSIINISLIQAIIYLGMWILFFIIQNNNERSAKLIYCALCSSFHCVVLISVYLYRNREGTIGIFKKRFLQDYNDTERHFDVDTNSYSRIMGSKTEESCKIQQMEDMISLLNNEYFSLLVSHMYSGSASELQKGAILSTYDAISKTRFKLNSTLMSSYLIRVGKELFIISHKRKDYAFSINILEKMISLFNAKKNQLSTILKKAVNTLNALKVQCNTTSSEGRGFQENYMGEIKTLLLCNTVLVECKKNITESCDIFENRPTHDTPNYIMNCYHFAISQIDIKKTDIEITDLIKIVENIENREE